MKAKKSVGKLVAVGGAEDKEGECLILKEFVRLAGGARARLVVMTVATDHVRRPVAEEEKGWIEKNAAEAERAARPEDDKGD